MMPGTHVVGRPSAGGSQYGKVTDLGIQRGQLVVYVQWVPPRPNAPSAVDDRWRDCVPPSHVIPRGAR